MPVTVEHVSRDELRRRLEAALNQVGLTLEELTDLAFRYRMTPDEKVAWEEVKRIQFLLGE